MQAPAGTFEKRPSVYKLSVHCVCVGWRHVKRSADTECKRQLHDGFQRNSIHTPCQTGPKCIAHRSTPRCHSAHRQRMAAGALQTCEGDLASTITGHSGKARSPGASRRKGCNFDDPNIPPVHAQHLMRVCAWAFGGPIERPLVLQHYCLHNKAAAA